MIENTILSHLVYNDEYTRKVLPFLKKEYFQDEVEALLFDAIDTHIKKYNTNPSRESLILDVTEKDGLNQKVFEGAINTIENLRTEETNLQVLLDKTELFCQDQAINNALREAVSIAKSQSGSVSKTAIPKIMQDALAVSFDTNVGHDYLDDYLDRYDLYHRKEERLPFDLEYFNKVTKGGLIKKTLNILLAATGIGKTLVMCHMAAGNLVLGKNVLYITLEMAQERIAERIDANLLNVPLDDLISLPKDMYEKKIQRIKSKTNGKLIIKEYPTASVGAAHFRHLLNELRLKRNFVPDVIYIDYLNICASSRIKAGAQVNSYNLIKSISEELRGLAIEFNVPIMTATQTNRSGAADSDYDVTAISDSFGTAMTADLILAIMSSEELEELNQLRIKQIKNRYSDPTQYKSFVVGVDRPRMRLYDTEQNAQEDLSDGGDKSTFDKSSFGQAIEDEGKKKPKWKRFTGFS